jgi:hypothetical protein
MKDECLKGFFLVGGTALALQLGHRISIDLDFFSLQSFDKQSLLLHLENKYGFQLAYEANNTLKGEISHVQVDLITHNYPLVKSLNEIESIRMASSEDIAAMKLNAISGDGTRLKDFIDIAYLSSSITLAVMVDAYETKYKSRNPTMVVKALNYHHDINFREQIEMLDGKYNWKQIEQRITEMTKHPHQLFTETLGLGGRPKRQQQELTIKRGYGRGRGGGISM